MAPTTELKISPIGFFSSSKEHPFETARQPQADALSSQGQVHLLSGQNFEQALQGLELFSHIWLIFWFHKNSHWKPMVLPPRGTNHKQGVFATRAPYRPNPIGMSVVKLVKIEGLVITVEGVDLMDQTPILDLKPYVPSADLELSANFGWIEQTPDWRVAFSPEATSQLEFLRTNGVTELESFLRQQLAQEPTDSRRKRVEALGHQEWELAYRTWRARFRIEADQIQISALSSGYSKADLESAQDTYADKDLHREFNRRWSRSTGQSKG